MWLIEANDYGIGPQRQRQINMEYNNLLKMIEAGVIDPNDPEVKNELAAMLDPSMPQPRYDIAPMQQNTMRFESGPDAGRVVDMNFAAQQAQQPQERLGARAEVPGKGVGRYSADGSKVVGNGWIHDLFPRRTEAAEKAAMQRAKDEADLRSKGASTAKTLDDLFGNRAKRDQEAQERAFLAGDMPETTGADGTRRGSFGASQDLLEKKYGKLPEGMRWRADGTPEPVMGNDPNAPMKLTEAQGKAMTFGSRVANSHEILNEVGENGRIQPNLVKRAAEGVPFIGGALGTIANKLPDFGPIGGPSAAQQQVEQAERDFINATLRRESGAVISDSEFDNARRQYFPQPGDSPEVIMQKRRNREIVVDSMATESGPARRKVLNAGEQIRAIFKAKKAVEAGAPREVVRRRLEENGIRNHGI